MDSLNLEDSEVNLWARLKSDTLSQSQVYLKYPKIIGLREHIVYYLKINMELK